MLPYAEAISKVLQKVQALPPLSVPLEEALGKVLAEPVYSCFDLPPTDISAMDGYAFKFNGLQQGVAIPVCGFLPAGLQAPEAIADGSAIKIMTGAPMPPGCDTVVPVEDVDLEDDRIVLTRTVEQGQHVRYRGEEITSGEEVLAGGAVLRAGEIGLLAATGHHQLKVIPSPRVAVLSTGDELVAPGEIPGPGQIVNSNLPLLCSRLREEGCIPIPIGAARDEKQSLTEMMASGLRQADLLVTTGGVSVGDHDLVKESLQQLGFEKIFWKVKIKPGKPVLFGMVGNIPVLGLPGNPAASAATFEIFVRPAIRCLSGLPDPIAPRLPALLAEDIKGGAQRERFIWGTLERTEDQYLFHPGSRQQSGQNRSLQDTQALLSVPAGDTGMEAGSRAEVLMVRMPPGTSVY